jgi:hypothetical protein
MLSVVEGGEWAGVDGRSFSASREDAQQILETPGRKYATVLRAINPTDLDKNIGFPWDTMKLGRGATLPVVDTVHHHGQIATSGPCSARRTSTCSRWKADVSGASVPRRRQSSGGRPVPGASSRLLPLVALLPGRNSAGYAGLTRARYIGLPHRM